VRIYEIVTFWAEQRRTAAGEWLHPLDEPEFGSSNHSFNLDFPVSPYVGDVVSAPVIILGANAGYDPAMTPEEFSDELAIQRYVDRVRAPSTSDWSSVSRYYNDVNYGELIADGRAVLVNACPYRSPKISAEPENKLLLNRLPSTTFARRWLLESVFPLAQSGERLVVAKRPGLWNLTPDARGREGVVFDPAPVSKQIASKPWAAVVERLGLYAS